jgi:formamidopyrimidine-DNA glycosylase
MPEMPEVETVVRGLRKCIIGKTIKSVSLNAPQINQDNKIFPLTILRDKTFKTVRRRGKNILIDLNDNFTLWVHLKMTGHLYFKPETEEIGKHDLIIFNLINSRFHLRFNDYRRFGRVRLFKTDEVMNQKGLYDLGPEPLEILKDDFIKLFRFRHRMIKPALLDQTLIAGLGNIYADETLYLSRIHPRRLIDSISAKKLGELHSTIRKVLKKAIALMGTSVDSYAGVDGRPGGYQSYLRAYGREGESCSRCGTKIRREIIGSRSAHFCPRCQRRR